LEIVSAYVLAGGGQAAVVDTGTDGSADDIEAVLAGLDFGWGDVSHVIVTHRHPDHVGGARAGRRRRGLRRGRRPQGDRRPPAS
jgi:glyoxylase-like metal-dependent hydrolase (beta-lactamase superfamily II)